MTTILYLIFFYTLHTPVYLSHILFVPVKGVKASFFWLNPKEPKTQDHIRSFLLKEKNQKFKAYTPEATVLVAALKSRKTRFAQTAEIF